MKTRYLLLAGLGLAAAATAFLYRTERGKQVRKGLADNLLSWKDKLTELAHTENGTTAKASEKRHKQPA